MYRRTAVYAGVVAVSVGLIQFICGCPTKQNQEDRIGTIFGYGVYDCPLRPEGMQCMTVKWGPLPPSRQTLAAGRGSRGGALGPGQLQAAEIRFLLIAHGSGVAFYDLLQSPPKKQTVIGLFGGGDIGQLYGAVAFSTNPQAIFGFGPQGTHFQTYDTTTASFGMTQYGQGAAYDAVSIGGALTAPGFTYVKGSSVIMTRYNSVSQSWEGPYFDASLPKSAYAHSASGPVIWVSGGTPGKLYVKDLSAPSDPSVLIGNVRNDPRRLRFLSPVGAVSNFTSDSLTIFTWDGASMTPVIVGSVPVGDGPVGIDLIHTGTNVAVVSTGYNDNTYSVTVIAPDGGVVSNTKRSVPAGVTNPGHAIFVTDDEGIKVIITGNGSSNFAIAEAGL